MSFPRYKNSDNELYDYTDEELNFIFGNLDNDRVVESQKEAILNAFEQAKEECLIQQNKSQIEKSLNEVKTVNAAANTAMDQQNYSPSSATTTSIPTLNPKIMDYSLTATAISSTPTSNSTISNYLNYPLEKKHRHCNSFFNKFRSKHTTSELLLANNTLPVIPQQSVTTLINQLQSPNYRIPTPNYKFDEEKYFGYELKLLATDNDQEARDVVKDMLTKEGSLWVTDPNGVDSFNNRFLCSLRHTTIDGYKRIIEEKYLQNLRPNYRYRFQAGEIDLFRGDSRSHEQIFKNGFDLWPHANKDTTPKTSYVNSGQLGISTSSAMNISRGYGSGQVFKIHLPANHHLLSIPLGGALDTNAPEINFLDNIPPQYIRSVVTRSGNEMQNPNFSPDVILSPKVRRGCY